MLLLCEGEVHPLLSVSVEKQESNKIVSRRQLCGVEIGFVEKKNCRMIIKHRWPRVAISSIFLMKHKYCAQSLMRRTMLFQLVIVII